MSDSLQPHELQHARPPCPSPTPGVHSDSRPLSQWCHPAISCSVVPFSSCPQSLPASESFPMSQLFAWGGQSTGVSALASFLTKKSQGWTPSLLDHSWSLLSCLQVLVWWSCLARQLSYDFKKCFVKIVNIWVYFLILCLCFLHFKQYSSKEFITFTRLPERPRHKKD